MQRALWSVAALFACALALPAASAVEVHDAASVVERAQAVAVDAAQDPGAAASDPQNVVGRILEPGDAGQGDGADGPTEDRNPGFADRIRAAFQDEAMFLGLAGLAATLLGVGGFALVSRYVSPKEALKNPQRAMLYGFVRGNPGVHLKKLSDEFAMKTSSILWHIRKLESAELVRSERANGFRVFYPVEGGIEIRRVSRALTALQNLNARTLFEAVDGRPGQSVGELAERLRIHAGTVRWHLHKLRDFGLVEELVRDDGSTYYGTSLGRRALETLMGAPVETPSFSPRPAAVPVLE